MIVWTAPLAGVQRGPGPMTERSAMDSGDAQLGADDKAAPMPGTPPEQPERDERDQATDGDAAETRQRRDSLRKEIRAGWQRALGH